MSAQNLDQLQSLLAQLQDLNLKDPSPGLEQHFSILKAAASATQAELQKPAEQPRGETFTSINPMEGARKAPGALYKHIMSLEQ